MEKSTTTAGAVAAAIVEQAWQQVGSSFERFCLTAGVSALTDMMEGDAARLCGARYGRDDGKDGYRWGRAKGKLGFHGGKIELERPRVRARAGSEIALPSWEAAMAEDWLGRWALNLMLINVSTRKFGRPMRLPEGDVPAAHGAGLSRSAASRRFIALSAERMKEWMASDLSKLDLRSAFLARAATGRWKKPSARRAARGRLRRFTSKRQQTPQTEWWISSVPGRSCPASTLRMASGRLSSLTIRCWVRSIRPLWHMVLIWSSRRLLNMSAGIPT